MMTAATVMRAEYAPATRAVARHASERMFDGTIRWQAMLGLARLDLTMFHVVLAANLADRRDADALLAPTAERRPISLLAVAESMRLPYETVRRRMIALVEAGKLRRTTDGFVVPDDVVSADAMRALIRAEAAALRAMIDRVAAAGHLAAARARAPLAAAPDGRVEHAQLDFAVRAIQTFVEPYGGFVPSLVVAGMVMLNVRHLVLDPALDRRFATDDHPPSDDQRQPASVRALSRELELPFETVRRQIAALAARGVVEPRGGGWIVPVRVITGEAHRRGNRFLLTQFDRMLDDIARG